MTQQQLEPTGKRSISTRAALLLVLVVGLGAGLAAYSIGNALAVNNTAAQNQLSNTPNPQWYGPSPGPWYGQRWNHSFNGSFTSFRAATTATNVTVTGYSITDSSHITVNLSYSGTGSAPALTIVAVAPGLSGSNTATAGWGATTTVSVHLVGSGSLSSTSSCIRVLVVPLTGA